MKVILEECKGTVRTYRDEVRKAKTHLELKRVRDVKGYQAGLLEVH